MSQFIHSIFSSISTFVLLPVPLFIIMGEILVFSGVFVKAVDVLDLWMARISGRLCIIAIGAATIFSCISGSSMACTAMLGSLLLPDMLRRGYHKSNCRRVLYGRLAGHDHSSQRFGGSPGIIGRYLYWEALDLWITARTSDGRTLCSLYSNPVQAST